MVITKPTQTKQVQKKPVTSTAQTAPVQSDKTNGMAIASMVLGIVGIVLIPIIAPILAIIFGIVALNQISKEPQKGKGMAIAGLIMGGVGIVLFFVAIIFLATLIPFAMVGSMGALEEFESGGYLSERCSLGASWQCDELYRDTANLHFTMTNQAGGDVQNLIVNFASPLNPSCSGSDIIGSVASGESVMVTIPCASSRESVSGTVQIAYTTAGTMFPKQDIGSITVSG